MRDYQKMAATKEPQEYDDDDDTKMTTKRLSIFTLLTAVSSPSSLLLLLSNQQGTARAFLSTKHLSTTTRLLTTTTTTTSPTILPKPLRRFISSTQINMAPRKKKQKTTTVASSKTENDADESPSTPTSKFIVILSPAKTLDLNCNLQSDEPIEWSQPGHVSLEKTNGIIKRMKEHSKSTSKLSKLLGVSTKLGETAKSYWDDMNIIDDSDSAQTTTTTTQKYKSIPCAFLFQGPAYQGLDIKSSLSTYQTSYLQNHLRIVDPLYGWLRPMDAIQPYRLEMNTKNLFGDKVKLADYWRPAIQSILLSSSTTTKTEDENGNDDIVIINLASDEYASAVPSDSNNDEGDKIITTIKVVFRTKGRVIGVHAKRARGLYAKFLAQNHIDTLARFYDSVKDFDMEHYTYQSHDSNIVVYDRTTIPKPTTTSKKAAASKVK